MILDVSGYKYKGISMKNVVNLGDLDMENSIKFNKTATVNAKPITNHCIIEQPWGETTSSKPGDMIVESGDERYVMEKEVFCKTYKAYHGSERIVNQGVTTSAVAIYMKSESGDDYLSLYMGEIIRADDIAIQEMARHGEEFAWLTVQLVEVIGDVDGGLIESGLQEIIDSCRDER